MNKLKTEMKQTKTYIPSGHPVLEKFPKKITSDEKLLEILQPLAEKHLKREIKDIRISSSFAWVNFKDTIPYTDDYMIRFSAQMTKKTGYMFGRIDNNHNRIVIMHQQDLNYWK